MGTTVVYKPLGFTASVTSGLLARAVFKQMWKWVAVKRRLQKRPTAPTAGERSFSRQRDGARSSPS
jgi:hypothetical protein